VRAPDGRAVAEAHAPRFAAYFRVRHYEADALGHVNNAAYLHYLEQAAIEHSAAVGYPLRRYQEMGTLFIVRRHEIDYLRPASPGDVLEVVT
jgi:acyl-CoA thioester hydrolase